MKQEPHIYFILALPKKYFDHSVRGVLIHKIPKTDISFTCPDLSRASDRALTIKCSRSAGAVGIYLGFAKRKVNIPTIPWSRIGWLQMTGALYWLMLLNLSQATIKTLSVQPYHKNSKNWVVRLKSNNFKFIVYVPTLFWPRHLVAFLKNVDSSLYKDEATF